MASMERLPGTEYPTTTPHHPVVPERREVESAKKKAEQMAKEAQGKASEISHEAQARAQDIGHRITKFTKVSTPVGVL